MSESTDDTAEAQESFPNLDARKMEKKTPYGGRCAQPLGRWPDGLVGYVAAPARSGETFSLISRDRKGRELLLRRVRGTSLIQHSCLCEDGTPMIALWQRVEHCQQHSISSGLCGYGHSCKGVQEGMGWVV